ncbi:TIGR04211 family SH3 domain-containing protein [Utexia brackfieldae]|uniref:TIGR04211 family SH3 domain-containing protein n=1 Tax=Utexia brackfieldae TaxID=3074108 RepID=UPI00370D22B5
MNKYLISLLLSASVFSTAAIAAEKYVSDDLSIYLRRGPGTQYGLSGTLNAGDKVTILETSADGKFTRIQDEKGRAAWIETSALSDVPSLRIHIPQLEQQITSLKAQISELETSRGTVVQDIQDKLSTANQTIDSLKTENEQLQAKVNEQQQVVDSVNNQLDEKRQSLILNWFLYGGIVAGGGLVLGLILPAILPRRRKKDRWMN